MKASSQVVSYMLYFLSLEENLNQAVERFRRSLQSVSDLCEIKLVNFEPVARDSMCSRYVNMLEEIYPPWGDVDVEQKESYGLYFLPVIVEIPQSGIDAGVHWDVAEKLQIDWETGIPAVFPNRIDMYGMDRYEPGLNTAVSNQKS